MVVRDVSAWLATSHYMTNLAHAAVLASTVVHVLALGSARARGQGASCSCLRLWVLCGHPALLLEAGLQGLVLGPAICCDLAPLCHAEAPPGLDREWVPHDAIGMDRQGLWESGQARGMLKYARTNDRGWTEARNRPYLRLEALRVTRVGSTEERCRKPLPEACIGIIDHLMVHGWPVLAWLCLLQGVLFSLPIFDSAGGSFALLCKPWPPLLERGIPQRGR